MQVGSTVWNGDKAGVVLSNDDDGVTVGYFASVETLTSDSENPSPLSSSPTTDEPEPAAATATDGPPPPAAKPATEVVDESAGTSADVKVDPLAALTEDERATFTRLQSKIDGTST